MRGLAAPSPVTVVLQGCAYPKMSEVHARRVVPAWAGVQRPLIVSKLHTSPKHEAEARRAIVLPLVANATISVIAQQCRPRPAPIWSGGSINSRPESLFERSHAQQATGACAELLAIPARDLARLSGEGAPALLASQMRPGRSVASPGAELPTPLANVSRHDLKGCAASSADAIALGNLYGHRAYSSVSGPGQVTLRRGRFVSKFYQMCRRAFAPIVDASEMERSA